MNTYYLIPNTYYLLPNTYYLLPNTYYLLPNTYYLIPLAYLIFLQKNFKNSNFNFISVRLVNCKGGAKTITFVP